MKMIHATIPQYNIYDFSSLNVAKAFRKSINDRYSFQVEHIKILLFLSLHK